MGLTPRAKDYGTQYSRSRCASGVHRNKKRRSCPVGVDAVEKVGDGAPARNNRIVSDDFLNRTCAFGGRLESILFRGPPQNPFSTASTQADLGRRWRVSCWHPPFGG